MASPFSTQEQGDMQLALAAAPVAETEDDSEDEVQRRLMNVKVLYTFDDQNKSNCLVRLTGVLNIPTVSLDETTQVGIIELKACIQAIIGASPELVAKLGHDYTVYAYDYSEYETPLVGQGMLSWILASASSTPNAPADQSQTMVTGRVCKNILGLFSKGIKETLEVKLKLIPVPTCHQREYVENMERYHSLSRVMPEGLDYQAWADFLRANPAIAQLAHPSSGRQSQMMQNDTIGDMCSMQPMLTQSSIPPQQSYPDQSQMYGTRPSSPALSAISFTHYHPSQDRRPASQASFRSEAAAPVQYYPPSAGQGPEQMEEGPPKKRARVTKATRPRKTPLATKNESLRVTASTAASVRLHKPANTNPATDIASMEQVPRAPTPRPGDRHLSQTRGLQNVAAPSLLRRHTSVDETRAASFPYDSAMFSDVLDSADDERGNSPGETSMDIPSSPPLLPQGMISSAPSSPGLPALPYPSDSGFVSDMPTGRDDYDAGSRTRTWEGSDLPTAPDNTRTRRRQDRSHHPWTEVTPGPVELLPKSYIAKPKTYPRPCQSMDKMDKGAVDAVPASGKPVEQPTDQTHSDTGPPESRLESHTETNPILGPSSVPPPSGIHSEMDQMTTSLAFDPSENQQPATHQNSQAKQVDMRSAGDQLTVDLTTNDAPPPPPLISISNPFPKPARATKRGGLPRSQTWSGEPMSDAVSESGMRHPRSGSGAKRKQRVTEQLQESLAAGLMPTYCNHCGEIETPTWRKAYTRVEHGVPSGIQLSSEGTSIVGFEVIESTEDAGYPMYRIFKQALDKLEKETGTFQQLNLCNPCGLWLNKKNAMRPRELWGPKKKSTEKGKRKRNPPKNPRKKAKSENDEIQSDAIVPHSEPVMRGGDEDRASTEGPSDSYMAQSRRYRSCSSQLSGNADTSQMDDATAMAALHRAIQSSPVGLGSNRKSHIHAEPDLTPKPTRRLLFPSPRRSGEAKSLSPTAKPGSEKDGPVVRLSIPVYEDTDKENCHPSSDHDDLAHLFEENISTKPTPTNDASLLEAPKTPTLGSRHRAALGTKRDGDLNAGLGLTTPSRNILTPSRNGRTSTNAPDTPLTRQLNAWFSSPSKGLDFSSFPDFSMTPGRSLAQFPEYNVDDFLSSDMPITSSPSGGLGFSVFEDPATSTVGLWSGASIFEGSDSITMGDFQQQGQDQESVVKSTLISVDLTAMIDGVVKNGTGNGNGTENEGENAEPNDVEEAEVAQVAQ